MQTMASHGKGMIENERNADGLHHSKEIYAHPIEIQKESKLYDILKQDQIMVNSRHNNHIKDAGIQKISALSKDNIIEAIENPHCAFNMGVQWHPELLPPDDLNSQKIFESLVDHAKQYQKH